MPLPSGIGFDALAGGNVDFGLVEGVSALQRNPQLRVAHGVGVQNLTGSVVYAVIPSGGSVSVSDMSGNAVISGLSTPFTFAMGIPTVNPTSGGQLTVTPSNLSTVFVTVVYK